MARPNVKILESSPISVSCNQSFTLRTSVTAYNLGEVNICIKLPDKLPCDFKKPGGELAKQVCKTFEATTIGREEYIDFELLIDCSVEDKYITRIMVTATDSANEKSRLRYKILVIDAPG